MFRILLKKQLFEVFRSWFYNGKTGKARSRGATVGMALLFGLLMVVVIGGSFTAVAVGIAKPFYLADVGYLYFVLFGLIAAALGLFGSVFNTYSGLYLAKDNDLLLSLPIPSGVIAASRLAGTYLMGLLYSAVVFTPGAVVWQIVVGFNLRTLIGSIVMLAEISLLIWVLSCLLGFVAAKISLKLKNRSFITVLAALLFMGLYYFVYFKAQVIIQDMVTNAAIYGAKLKGSAYLLYLWGQNGLGSLPELILCPAACVILAALTWLILSKTFLGLATAVPQEAKSSVTGKAAKAHSLSAALLKKEFSRFTSSANYMLNCGFGVLFIPAMGIVLLIKGSTLITMLSSVPGIFSAVIPVGLAGIACMLAAMNDSGAPSVSLEGKSLWLIRTLPIDPFQIIRAKMAVQLFLTEIPMLFYCICVALLPLSVSDKVMCIILSLLYPVLSALFNLFVGLKMPIFNWSSEIVPIKQSDGVAIALFGGWGYALLLIGGYIGLSLWLGIVSVAGYLAAFAILTVFASIILYRWLKVRGTKLL